VAALLDAAGSLLGLLGVGWVTFGAASAGKDVGGGETLLEPADGVGSVVTGCCGAAAGTDGARVSPLGLLTITVTSWDLVSLPAWSTAIA